MKSLPSFIALLLASSCWAQTTFYSGSTTGTATKLGGFTFYNLRDSKTGKTTTGTAQKIGPFEFYSLRTTGGSTLTGNSQRLGPFTFHSLRQSNPSSLSTTSFHGTSQRLGPFTFHNLYGSDGSRISGTSQTLEPFTFSTYQVQAAPSYTPTYILPMAVNARSQYTAVDLSTVLFKSIPVGADITVNGKFVGMTPSTLKLPAGDYTLIIQKPAFRPWNRTLTLSSGTSIRVDATLQNAP